MVIRHRHFSASKKIDDVLSLVNFQRIDPEIIRIAKSISCTGDNRFTAERISHMFENGIREILAKGNSP
jgi:hypothetical protein